jgi:serine/threonine protein kinase
MEYAPNQSLDKLISQYSKQRQRFQPFKVAHFLEELASALHHIHDRLHIMHRDIKPANILVDQLGTLKLADFGLSKTVGPTNLASTFCGSPLYMAPEQLSEASGGEYSFSADMWALGCVLFELMTFRSPWLQSERDPCTYPLLVQRILTTTPDYSLAESLFPTPLVDSVKWLLQRKMHRRATAADLLSLTEMRVPPALDVTIHPVEYAPAPPKAPPSKPSPKPKPTKPSPTKASSDLATLQRQRALVDDAERLAALFLQKNFRDSLQRKAKAPVVEPLRPVDRLPDDFTSADFTSIDLTPEPQKEEQSAKILQSAFRTSLQRRQRVQAPRPKPVPPARPGYAAKPKPSMGGPTRPMYSAKAKTPLFPPVRPASGGSRLQTLATPRTRRVSPHFFPPVNQGAMPARPRPAWV